MCSGFNLSPNFQHLSLKYGPSVTHQAGLEKNVEAGNVLKRRGKRLRVRNRESSAALPHLAE